MTCMYVRLLGPCFKTGRKPGSNTPTPGIGRSLTSDCKPRQRNPTGTPGRIQGHVCPKFPYQVSPAESQLQPCLTRHRTAGSQPYRCLSTSRDVRFTLDGFHALLAPQTRCFSAFPYGTCLLSVTTLSYLALDGQHHPYSASTFKLTYSRAHSLPVKPTRSRVTPCAPGSQPVCCKPSCLGMSP
jgi:hypothetical protein